MLTPIVLGTMAQVLTAGITSSTSTMPAVLNITVNPSNVTTTVTPYMYGSGIESYEHQMYGGIWSNMLYDSSFEDTAPFPLHDQHHHQQQLPQQQAHQQHQHHMPVSSKTPQSWYLAPSSTPGACAVTDARAFNGNKSMRLDAGCALRNRGLVATPKASSMHFVGGGKKYEGYIFATSSSGSTIRISAFCNAIGDFNSDGKVLGSVDIAVKPSESWNQYNFTLDMTGSCLQGSAGGSAGGSGSTKGQGLVQVALASGAATPTLIDELMFEPGEWGRYTSSSNLTIF